jgi:hypothetical protein
MFRIQQSSDNQAYSDGALMVVEDIEKVKSSLDRPLVVTLPPEVTAPGVPISPTDDPGNVHLSLYLLRTCKTQPVTLHAVREVSFDGAGAACDVTRPEGATIDPACEAPPFSTDPRGDGKSRIVFHSIFAGDTATLDSEPRRTRGCFDIYLADPREVNGATLAPPRCRGPPARYVSISSSEGRARLSPSRDVPLARSREVLVVGRGSGTCPGRAGGPRLLNLAKRG